MLDVVGAPEVIAGRARTASGIQINGQTITFHFTKPAANFALRIGSPYFSAIPPGTPDAVQTAPIPSGGPYYASSVTGRTIVLKKNKLYRGPRPQLAEGFVINTQVTPAEGAQHVAAGEADVSIDALPDATYRDDAARFGINQGRFQVHPRLETSYIPLNTSRPLFRNNVPLRKAVNYAVDRPAMLGVRYLHARHTWYSLGVTYDNTGAILLRPGITIELP